MSLTKYRPAPPRDKPLHTSSTETKLSHAAGAPILHPKRSPKIAKRSLLRSHHTYRKHQASWERPLRPTVDRRLLLRAGHALMARRPISANFSREAPSRAWTARPRATAL